MSQLQISRAVARNTTALSSALQISRAIVSTTTRPTNSALKILNVSASTPPSTPVTTSAAQAAIEPLTVVTLTGTGDSPGVWSQISGAPVSLAGSGATVTYVAPQSITPAVLRFTYTVAGQSAAVEHTVLPVTERVVAGGVESPLELWGN